METVKPTPYNGLVQHDETIRRTAGAGGPFRLPDLPEERRSSKAAPDGEVFDRAEFERFAKAAYGSEGLELDADGRLVEKTNNGNNGNG